MARARIGQIDLEYESLGDPAAPPVLLIMGLGAQLVRWPEAFCQALVSGGYRAIRFDNRDVGLSAKMSGHVPVLVALGAAALGRPMALPYTLQDMAEDARGLLDHLGIERAHVIGTSMGGMIGQILAARHGARLRSFVSIMSTSGSLRLPGPRWDIRRLLMSKRPQGREARIERMAEVLGRIGSQVHKESIESRRARAARELDRCDYAPGYLRQLTAVVGSPSRLPLLPQIRVPTLVLHGQDDPMVPVAAAFDLQSRIPGAELEIVPGMAHDMPLPLLPRVTERVLRHLRRADAATQTAGAAAHP